MRTIKPLGDRLLVAPSRNNKNPSGKIQIPDVAKWEGECDHEFWVIAVGPKVRDIQPRDRVICAFDHDGLEPVYSGDPQRRGFIRQSQVVAVFRSE